MTWTIRKAAPGEETMLWELYHDTIHHVACRDYSPEQLQAWAPDEIDPERWREKIEQIAPFVCLHEETIVGYADLQSDGLIDHFFVHHRWQRRGVGRRLMERLEQDAARKQLQYLHAHVSKTARPFFESHGFVVLQEQQVNVHGVTLTNFKMQKLQPCSDLK